MSLGIQIGVTTGSGINSPLSSFTGIIDTFTGAEAAYSVRRLSSSYDSFLIRVRRSSGSEDESDIGFDANGDLDTTALLAFVNADYNAYTSDFSSGTDSFSEHSTTNAGNIDGVSDGTTSKDDVLRVTMTGGNTSHQIRKANIFDGANTYNVSFEYYIPSSNIKLDQIVFRTNVGGDGDTAFSNVGTWSTGSISDFTPSGTQVRFNATDGGAFIFDENGDVFYLKNIVVTQTTADGFVTKIYNQSGTGGSGLPSERDLVQGTSSKQAKIVNAGTLLTEGGKPCIKANIDGSTVYGTYSLATAYEFAQPSFSIFSVVAHGTTATTYLISGSTIGDDRLLLSATRLRYNINGSGNYDINQTIDRTRVVDMYINDGTLTYYQDSSEIGNVDVSASNSNNFEFKNLGSGGNNNNTEEFQELIIYPEDKDTSRADIRDNMNTYFSVY